MTTPSASFFARWNPWPVSIVVFFTVAILGCVTFVAFCSRHPAELISANYYEEEVHYQGQMERQQRGQEAALPGAVSYNPGSKQIVVSLPTKISQAKLEGKIQLYRPSAINQDRQLNLDLDSHGVQTIDAANLPPGLWKVRVSWRADNRDYFIDQRVVIPSRI
jgi:nitrogen fixation protein FixH